MFKPKKHTPATVRFVDVPGVTKGGAQSLNLPSCGRWTGSPSSSGASPPRPFPPEGSVDPARDLELIETEMLLSDLSVVTNRLERVVKDVMKKKSPELEAEKELLARYKATLEKGDALRRFEVTPDEQKLVRGFGLLSLKPMLVVLNADEKDAGDLAGALSRATSGHGGDSPGSASRRSRPPSSRRSRRCPPRTRRSS